MKSLHQQQGVGLIEVMIAAIVFAVGVAALVRLQGNFFKSSSSANARSIAMSIAEEKMEDLRGFEAIDSDDPDIFDFTSIGSNTGGRRLEKCTPSPDNTDNSCPTLDLGPGTVPPPPEDDNPGDLTFTRNWTSTPYYYNGTTLTATPNGTVVQKLVTVNVSWTDTDGTAQTATLSSIINSTATAMATGVISKNIGGSGEQPVVFYTPQAAPDVIAQPRIATTSSSTSSSSTSSTSSTSTTSSTSSSSSGGNCAIYTETDKPNPTIDNNSGGIADNNIISFSTITYKQCSGATPVALKKEEFATLNCSCELSNSPGSGYDQGHNAVTKAKTGQANGQHELCVTCCRDHHENITGNYVCDYSSTENRKKCYTPFRNDFSNNDHNHYATSSATSPVSSGTYHEACRLKRVAGYWTVVNDWNLAGINVFVRSDLTNSTNLSSYQNYVANTVNNYVNNGTTAAAWTVPSPTTPVNTTQMMTRGIFVDYMSPSEKSGLNFSLTGLVPQEVPFYEYHVSSLADWKTTKSDGTNPNTSSSSPCMTTAINTSANFTCVDSPTVAQVANANKNQQLDKGVFRVGTGASAPISPINIVAEMKQGNTGITGTVAINSMDTPIKSASVTVPFSSSSGGTTIRSIFLAPSPSFTCPSKWGNGKTALTFLSQNISAWSTIGLSCSPSSGSTASCTNYASNQPSVTVTASNTNTLQCLYSGLGNIFSCPSSLSTTVTSLSGTKSCTISMSKSGTRATCALVCQ